MDETTVKTYNKLADEYDQETVEFWNNFPTAFIDRFKEQCGGKKILDVGSGPGRDAVLLKERGLDVVCLDASSAMIDITCSKGFESVEGDMLKLPFEAGTFYGVWAYTSLLHLPRREFATALVEIKRVVAPSGVFALGLIEGSGEEYKLSSGVREPRLFTLFSKDEIETELEGNGFKIVYFDTYKPKSKTYMNFLAAKAG